MASKEEIIQRLRDSKPPATDPVTYLTIVEMSLSPAILPELLELLGDAALTSEIGWDLVDMLISIPGSDACLETIARLGNPREVIIKVLEVMERVCAVQDVESEDEEGGVGGWIGKDDQNDEDPLKETKGGVSADGVRQFATLCQMLRILHKRLQVKAPSKFLHTTLDTVYKAYDPLSPESTATVVSLVESLSGQKRPSLPSRKSSIKVETAFQSSDTAAAAPDPEADGSDNLNANEPEVMTRLLQSFITCVIEAYANMNSMEWASRLLEYTYPERIVSGRPTMMQSFKEVDELVARDTLMGQLAALASDLGLSNLPFKETWKALDGTTSTNPLSIDFDPQDIERVKLSTGGYLCLTAYWTFASEVFDTDHSHPDIYLLPDHHAIFKRFFGEEPQGQIVNNPGTVEALIVIVIYLEGHSRISSPENKSSEATFMSFHHLLTLVSVFHTSIRVRNAATHVAGLFLHADPDEGDKLSILEDLLENCMFSSLQACAVSWLREEMIAAAKKTEGAAPATKTSLFGSPEVFDTLQYSLFPGLTYLEEADTETLLEFWSQNAPFHMQVANFALFLFEGRVFRLLAPEGMAAAIGHRYVQPLQHMVNALSEAIESKEIDEEALGKDVVLQLSLLSERLGRVRLD